MAYDIIDHVSQDEDFRKPTDDYEFSNATRWRVGTRGTEQGYEGGFYGGAENYLLQESGGFDYLLQESGGFFIL